MIKYQDIVRILHGVYMHIYNSHIFVKNFCDERILRHFWPCRLNQPTLIVLKRSWFMTVYKIAFGTCISCLKFPNSLR
jgi:hypothetical protein